MIDLRRLRVLRAVAYYGTVTAAAQALHLTPSAASQQVRQLGRELGVDLLEPHGRRVRLTQAARTLLSHADAIEERWHQAEADLAATATGVPSGTLRMCGFPTAVSTLLAPTASQLQRTWPTLTTQIREAEPADCFDLLFAGDADLAVVEATGDNPPRSDPRFDQQLLLDDPFDLLTAADHPLASAGSVRLTDLADQSWILGMPGSSSRQHVLAACNSAGFAPTVAHQAREWSVVATLVSHGLGIALVPRLAQLPPDRALTHVPLDTDRPSRHLVTVTLRGAQNEPAIAAALTHLTDTAGSRTATSRIHSQPS